ncbi:hypothetical protein NLC26_02225 [Candidatus Aminicenantes bacterium AC-708-M15]|jgi:hypothetical protein|nr:hypothetical protein [SCandidatus Aminicenantes bacterium Aminicenantia_JdfR_composite]MCP2596889.1 hypothetical protein [Candidatus Aminicenantes bacterium AC-335-G13]MCP2604278.1 hypothetical protein [Candidatus Aminicenantes bacterium AC-708-M15]
MLNLNSFEKYLFTFLIFLIIFNQNCHYAPQIVPSLVKSFEGYARINIKNSQILKSKIAFLFEGRRGRIDILNPFGNTKAQILIFSDVSYLTIPGKKVYWEGSTEEIMKVFLGFHLNIEEIKALLIGKWDGNLKDWKFFRNKDNRIKGGRRENVIFEIKEFFRDTSLPKIINFSYAEGNGKIKVLKIKFNQPVNPGAFSKLFLEYYERKTLDEIMELIKNGN